MIAFQHHKGDPALAQPLLVSNIWVGGDYSIESVSLSGLDQLAVRQHVPSHLQGGPNIMTGEGLAEATWGILVKQNP